MSNPVLKPCPKNVWTKVATNVTSGQVKKIKKDPIIYLETCRMTGNAAPTLQTEGALLFQNCNSATIESTDPIDVYVMALTKNGRVRVDL